jgi:hypothetical protein
MNRKGNEDAKRVRQELEEVADEEFKEAILAAAKKAVKAFIVSTQKGVTGAKKAADDAKKTVKAAKKTLQAAEEAEILANNALEAAVEAARLAKETFVVAE